MAGRGSRGVTVIERPGGQSCSNPARRGAVLSTNVFSTLRTPPATAPWKDSGTGPSGFSPPEAHFQPLREGRRKGPVFDPSPETSLVSPAGSTGSEMQSRGTYRRLQPPASDSAPLLRPRTRRVPERAPGRRPRVVPVEPAESRADADRARPNPAGCCRARPARARSPRPVAPAPGALPGDERLRAAHAACELRRGRGGAGSEAQALIGRAPGCPLCAEAALRNPQPAIQCFIRGSRFS